MAEILDKLIADIRRPILSGEYSPGSRLPNRSGMVGAYKASSATIQLAIEKLKQWAQGHVIGFLAGHPRAEEVLNKASGFPVDPGVRS